MGAIHNDWLQAVGGELRKPYYKELYDFVKEEYSTRVIYPPADDIFNALHLTPLKEVKVVILGQDPYHNEHGCVAAVCRWGIRIGSQFDGCNNVAGIHYITIMELNAFS